MGIVLAPTVENVTLARLVELFLSLREFVFRKFLLILQRKTIRNDTIISTA